MKCLVLNIELSRQSIMIWKIVEISQPWIMQTQWKCKLFYMSFDFFCEAQWGSRWGFAGCGTGWDLFRLQDTGLTPKLLRDTGFKYLRDTGLATKLLQDTGFKISRGNEIRSWNCLRYSKISIFTLFCLK